MCVTLCLLHNEEWNRFFIQSDIFDILTSLNGCLELLMLCFKSDLGYV